MKFPAAQAVWTEFLAEDAEFAAAMGAFYEGLASEEPEVPKTMSDDRASELTEMVRVAA